MAKQYFKDEDFINLKDETHLIFLDVINSIPAPHWYLNPKREVMNIAIDLAISQSEEFICNYEQNIVAAVPKDFKPSRCNCELETVIRSGCQCGGI
jgi:hypothetical protein